MLDRIQINTTGIILGTRQADAPQQSLDRDYNSKGHCLIPGFPVPFTPLVVQLIDCLAFAAEQPCPGSCDFSDSDRGAISTNVRPGSGRAHCPTSFRSLGRFTGLAILQGQS